MLSYLGHWSLMSFGYWALEEKETGRFIGELGFADFKRDIEPSLKGIPELGWALASPAHGKGYATEALRVVGAWGDARFGAAARALSKFAIAAVDIPEKEKPSFRRAFLLPRPDYFAGAGAAAGAAQPAFFISASIFARVCFLKSDLPFVAVSCLACRSAHCLVLSVFGASAARAETDMSHAAATRAASVIFIALFLHIYRGQRPPTQ